MQTHGGIPHLQLKATKMQTLSIQKNDKRFNLSENNDSVLES